MKKETIFLDLDNTIIYSVSKNEETDQVKKKLQLFDYVNMNGEYKVVQRPYLQEFLDYIFANFKVGIWTAASKSYAIFIIREIILHNHPERKIDMILFRFHCKISKEYTGCDKSLKFLDKGFRLPQFNPKTTYIVDDNDEINAYQPKKCFHIKPFDINNNKSEKDNTLKKMIPDSSPPSRIPKPPRSYQPTRLRRLSDETGAKPSRIPRLSKAK